MTVICYRDGIMAADSATWVGDFIVHDDAQKIIRTPAGQLVACAGPLPTIQAFYAWAMDGFKTAKKPDKCDNFGAVIVNADGVIQRCGEDMQRYEIMGDWVSEGAHSSFMDALLIAGHDAIEVVELAIRHCAYAGGRCVSMRLHEVAETEAA